MARERYRKLLTTLPDSYSANWLTKLDKRTKLARAVLDRIGELEADASGGDSLTAARRSLIRHAAWLDATVETHELRLASGEPIDIGAYTQTLNSLLGLFRLLGLERKAKSARTLRDVMAGHASPRPATPTTVTAVPPRKATKAAPVTIDATPVAPAERDLEDL